MKYLQSAGLTSLLLSGLLLWALRTPLPLGAQVSYPVSGVVNAVANLRTGPGTTYGVHSQVQPGARLTITGCNNPCTWYQLANGHWIATFLVDLVATTTAALVAEPTPMPLTVVAWNTELNGADVAQIGARIAAFQEVDLWGLSEINQPAAVPILEAAAEVGEAADYRAVLGQSGSGDRLLALYDSSRFTLVDTWEIDAINTTGNARAPLVLHLREASGNELLFMVNHLYRSRDEERHQQARLLNAWAAMQTLPVIAVGDYNFDWALNGGEADHDLGYDLLTADDHFTWVRPPTLVTTQCSGWPCEFNSVLDFTFTAGAAQSWRASAEIVIVPGDFPDDATTSDHRPILTRFWPSADTPTTDTPITDNPVATATRSPVASGPTANQVANLRLGPATTYPLAGQVTAGEALSLVGRNGAGDWYQLATGAWIAAFLVDGAPTTLALVEVTPPTAAPLPPTALPAAVLPPTAPPILPTAIPVAPTIAPAGVAQVVISTVYYDGRVARVESDEYAEIANVGNAAINIGGWLLNAGDDGQNFRFPSLELGPGTRVRIYTNEIHAESGGYSFGKGQAIWNNKGDCGYLFDSSGTQVDRYCY